MFWFMDISIRLCQQQKQIIKPTKDDDKTMRDDKKPQEWQQETWEDTKDLKNVECKLQTNSPFSPFWGPCHMPIKIKSIVK